MANVIIYSTPTCVYCKMAKEFFAKNNVAYVEKDVALDPAAKQELFAKGKEQGVAILGVPVLDINGKLIVGFDQHAVKEALGMQ